MQNLEQQKFEAIMLTFQQVTRNFEIVFKELVPTGRGHLTLLQGSEESSIEDTHPSMEELNRFTGIGVKVRHAVIQSLIVFKTKFVTDIFLHRRILNGQITFPI